MPDYAVYIHNIRAGQKAQLISRVSVIAVDSHVKWKGQNISGFVRSPGHLSLGFVGCLLNVPATCSETDLHRQFYVLPH